MLTPLLATFVLIFTIIDGGVLLYNTENEETVEKLDCVYYVPHYGEKISYCRRPGTNQVLNRHRNACSNEGKKKLFRDLLKEEIDPSVILKWSSSIEMADLYARVFYNRSLIDNYDDRFVCNCTAWGTFGKYCEYKLTHGQGDFSEAIKAQFQQKKTGDPWNTQRYGKILCYETLPCNTGPLCLDWREICDGIQRCSGGIDEENWDKLEFNECEDDEFRCTNGMCIAEEFWLDGNLDCMDWSDELRTDIGVSCPWVPNPMYCDEHLCRRKMYSCGDGQCVYWRTRIAFQRLVPPEVDCFNKRNLNYMCEVGLLQPAWTLENGLCCPEKNYNDPLYPPWKEIDSSKLTKREICEYLARCLFSDGFELDCPCNRQNCSAILNRLCTGNIHLILYPPNGLISGNMLFFYNHTDSMNNGLVNLVFIGGNLRCRGFYQIGKGYATMSLLVLPFLPHYNSYLCECPSSEFCHRDSESRFQYDKFCWKDFFTFNGRPYAVHPDTCQHGHTCISQYRIRDGTSDCLYSEDEERVFAKNYCTEQVSRHRFQCFDNESKCLPLFSLVSGTQDCSNHYDEVLFGSASSLLLMSKCYDKDQSDCIYWKEYIGQSSMMNLSLSQNINLLDANAEERISTHHIPFRSYCNSFWDFDDQMDESPLLCQYWICKDDQYQCQTGQCIELEWVCDGEWDCADASDEEAIVLIGNWSLHNERLIDLQLRRKQCKERYSNASFSYICNLSFEFGCYRSKVANPLDIQSNRPCINLTQIGDGVEHCYNAYDEKNTLKSNSTILGMWGFQFRCGVKFELFPYACVQKDNCSHVLCPNHRDTDGSCSDARDVICLEKNNCVKNGRCDGKRDCWHGDDEFWCASGSSQNLFSYRYDKKQSLHKYSNFSFRSRYPLSSEAVRERTIRNVAINLEEESHIEYSYLCNRGILILELNKTRCLCPPAYYGRWCQFFSDRISIIAQLDKNTSLNSISNKILKIKANLVFDNLTIDSQEFDIVPSIESVRRVKHKFYLIYSRLSRMVEHKRWRYSNQTDVASNHPYSVHLDVFALEDNQTVEELGSWRYPIYFDFLPAFRLAIVLRFPSWFRNATLDPCHQSKCNENSTCKPIFNQNRSHYCSCKKGYYGKECKFYESRCDSYCLPDALCRPRYDYARVHSTKIDCICPLGHFGRFCYLKYDECEPNPCSNDGTCSLTHSISAEESYTCQCLERFYGKQCEREKASVRVRFNMTKTSSIQATVVQLYDTLIPSLTLVTRYRKVVRGLPVNISYLHSDTSAPYFGLLATYDDQEQLKYFIIYAMLELFVDIESTPKYCPHVSSLLSKNITRSVPAIAQYHHLCRNHTSDELLCFHDEAYFCMCEEGEQRAECFIRDSRSDRCDRCLSGGKCFQGDRKDFDDFICICRPCDQGDLCELNMKPFGFTLDSLLVDFSTKVKIIYLIVVCLFFGVGFFNNYCSFVTFCRSSPRRFGTGNYLLVVTCLNQIGLFCLLGKFIEIFLERDNRMSCKTISFLLSVFMRSTYWLNSWISVNRYLVVLFPTSLVLKNSRLAIGISLFTVLVLLLMHVHELIYYTVIRKFSSSLSFCVPNFSTNWISTYNRISTLVHYLVTFFIQTISITLLIIFIARSHARVRSQQASFYQVLKKQFHEQKELYVTPTTIVLSALPQLLLAFSVACTEPTVWLRHMLLGAYLLSCAPQVLGFIFYVLPSTSYTKEFRETSIAKLFFH